VIVNYSTSADRAEAAVKAIVAEGGQTEAIGADLSALAGISGLLGAIDSAFGGRFKGRLDILVNNAGTVDYGPFLESSDDSYERQFNLNVRAPVTLSRHVAQRMIPAGWGRIINVGSALGEAAPLPGVTLYVTTKFALRGFTKGLSRELGRWASQ
jgi:3-oxoacyl-[acyl-carrier protein] reductase